MIENDEEEAPFDMEGAERRANMLRGVRADTVKFLQDNPGASRGQLQSALNPKYATPDGDNEWWQYASALFAKANPRPAR